MKKAISKARWMFSILGRKELGDGRGIDALRKRRDGSAVVTFIHLAHELRSKIPGAGSSSMVLKSLSVKYFLRMSILVRCVCHGVGKKALRKFKGFGNSRASCGVPNQKIRFATPRRSSE
jgi:hypothetical protein